MSRAAGLGAAALAASLAASVAAQPAADPVRLDDFALPAAANPSEAPQQLSERGGVETAPQRVDRTLNRPPAGERAAPRPTQLSAPGESAALPQLGTRANSAPVAGLAISSPGQSRPGAVARIGGSDRCDPQLVQRLYAECLRILELRSDEFTAPQPAALSAEQRLLVEQRQRDEANAASSATMRLRYASAAQPDADLASNQELASIFLDRAPGPQREEPAAGEAAEKLSEVFKGLGIETLPAVPPPQGN